jgi:tetratricopeptide (TPR) repeat protein
MEASLYIQRAELLMGRRRYDAAQKELIEALKLEPENIDAKTEMCWCLYRQKKYEEADKWADAIITGDPENYVGYYYKAACAGSQAKISKAHKYIDEAISANPFSSAVYAYKAELCLADEDWVKAEKYAREGLERNPDNIQCLQKLNAALAKQKAKSKLDENIRIVLQKSPDDPETHLSVGKSLLETGRPHKALTHFEIALQQNPGDEDLRQSILEAAKSKNLLYRWLLRVDYYVAAQSLPFQRGFMFISLILIVSVGFNLTENSSPYWLFAIIPLAFILQAMWLVKWATSVLLCLVSKKYRHYMPTANVTFKEFVKNGFSLAFLVLSIAMVTAQPDIIKYAAAFFLFLFINTFIWRNYFLKKIVARNPKNVWGFSFALTLFFSFQVLFFLVDANDMWLVIMFIFGVIYLHQSNNIYSLKAFN